VGRPAGALAAAAAARCGRCCLSSSFSAAGCAIASCRLRANRRRRSDQSTGDLVKIANLYRFNWTEQRRNFWSSD
jgi:hypothetical protein